jgi:hypothetical protein
VRIAVDAHRAEGASADQAHANQLADQLKRALSTAKDAQKDALARLPAAERNLATKKAALEETQARTAPGRAQPILTRLMGINDVAKRAILEVNSAESRVGEAKGFLEWTERTAKGAGVSQAREQVGIARALQRQAATREKYAQDKYAAAKRGEPPPGPPPGMISRQELKAQLKALAESNGIPAKP